MWLWHPWDAVIPPRWDVALAPLGCSDPSPMGCGSLTSALSHQHQTGFGCGSTGGAGGGGGAGVWQSRVPIPRVHPCPIPIPASPPPVRPPRPLLRLPPCPRPASIPASPPHPRPVPSLPAPAHTSMAPSGPPERGPLARMARDTLCPSCGQPLRDPVLLPCNHSCCRRCLHPPGTAAPPSPAAAVCCPRCHRTAAPHRLRTAVALAVETRIAQRLTRSIAAVPRRPQRRSLGAQLRADAAAPPGPPPPKEPPEGGGTAPTPCVCPPPLTPQ
ncbi:uncharacterized protein ACIB01_019521 [Guaruba guarouba]